MVNNKSSRDTYLIWFNQLFDSNQHENEPKHYDLEFFASIKTPYYEFFIEIWGEK